MKKVIALVPMKGHSERVPNKNLRLFGGRPLYHCIIHTLLRCLSIDAVYINTDSEAIAEDVKNTFDSRVKIIQRPKEICGDFIDMNTIIRYDLSQMDGDFFLQTHSTNPLLKVETIEAAIRQFFSNKESDSLFSVTRYQSRFYDANGKTVNHRPVEMLRTQDLPALYEENSNLYIFSRNSFNKHGRRIGEKPIFYTISRLESVDIDTPEDFKLAEILYEYSQRKN